MKHTDFNKWIRCELSKQKITCKAAAENAGMSLRTFYSMAEHDNPTIKTLIQIIESLGYEITIKKKNEEK